MLDMLDRRAPDAPRATLGHTLGHVRASDLFAAMLDEVDYPMLLVGADLALRYANTAARRGLNDGAACLQLRHGRLHCDADPLTLARAVASACVRGRRAMVHLSDAHGAEIAAAVVPVETEAGARACLLMLARPLLCEKLSADAYARSAGLTASESLILDALCRGLSALDIARDRGVELSTVRTQIGALRAKTGCHHIGELVRRMGELPPLVSALRPARG